MVQEPLALNTASIEADDQQLLIRRLRIGAGLSFTMIVTFTIADAWQHPDIFPRLIPWKLVQLSATIALLALIAVPAFHQHAVVASRTALVGFFIGMVGHAVVRADLTTMGVAVLTVVYFEAVLLPVSWRAHAVVPLTAGFAMLAASQLTTGSLTPVFELRAIALWVAGATSTLIGFELQRTRAEINRHRLVAEQSRDRLDELYRSAHERAEESDALERVGRALIASVELDAMLPRLCEVTAEVLHSDFARVIVPRADDGAFMLAASCNDPPEVAEGLKALALPRHAFGGLTARLENGEVIQIGQTINTELLPTGLQQRVGSTLSMFVPLRQRDELIGVLVAGFRGRTEPFSALAQRIATGIMRVTTLALANARLLAELDRANSVKDDFVSTMSHELRSPLNILIGYSDLLLEDAFGELSAEQREVVTRLRYQSQNLVTLVNAILDLSRLESGRLPLEAMPTDFAELLREVEHDVESDPRRANVAIHWDIEPGLPTLRTDRPKVRLILSNLVGNALKFTPSGTIRIAAKARDEGIEVSVADTGIGIAPDAQEQVFEPFRQADPTIAARFGGSGLGLSIVKRMTELLGGTITLESEAGVGSTFKVWLPRLPEATRTSAREEAR